MSCCFGWSDDFPVPRSAGGTAVTEPQTAPPNRGNNYSNKGKVLAMFATSQGCLLI